jgi:hypothetical protein
MIAMQTNMFGPPEPMENLSPAARYRDDAPVPCERELLWPEPHAQGLGADLLETLYGDIPRRTRLTVQEVCRRLRRGHTHIYELIEAGALDATDDRHPMARQAAYTIYRYSLVRFLFNREFVQNATRGGLPPEALDKCLALADRLRRSGRRDAT